MPILNIHFKNNTFNIVTKHGLLLTRVADGFLSRLRGLLFALPLQPAEALLLTPCNSVHTFGMRYAIDIVFLSPDCQIMHIVPHCPPGRFARHGNAKHTLELLAGGAEQFGLKVGSQVSMHLQSNPSI